LPIHHKRSIFPVSGNIIHHTKIPLLLNEESLKNNNEINRCDKMPKKKTTLIRSPDFKTIYAVGAIGNWTPYDFRINFYSEKVMEDEEESFINDSQVILSPKATKEFALWLLQNIKEYESTYGKLRTGGTGGSEEPDDEKFKSDLISDMKDDIKNELKDDIKTDLKKYLKQNIEEGIKRDLRVIPTPKLKSDLKKVLKADLQQDLRKDIKPELRKDLQRELRADLKQDLKQDLRKDIRKDLEREFQQKLRPIQTGTGTQAKKIKPKAKTTINAVKGSVERDMAKKTTKIAKKKK